LGLAVQSAALRRNASAVEPLHPLKMQSAPIDAARFENSESE